MDLSSTSNVAPLTSSPSGFQYQTSQTFRIPTPGRNILMPTYSEFDSIDNNGPYFMDSYSNQNENHMHKSEATISEDDFGYDVNCVDGSFKHKTGATSEQWTFANENIVEGDDSTKEKLPAAKRHKIKG